MRVLHVISAFVPVGGGPTSALRGMVRAVRAQGVDAEVATTDSLIRSTALVPLDARVEQHGVPVRYFHCPWLRKYGVSRDFARWIDAGVRDFDVLHIHGVFNHSTLAAARAARRRGVPYVLRTAGELDPRPMRKNHVLKTLFLRTLARPALAAAAAVHVTSRAEASGARPRCANRPMVVIPLATDPPGAVEPRQREEFLGQHPALRDAKVILFLSRLDPIKGFDVLLPALVRLRQEPIPWRLLLAGSGAPRFEQRLRRAIVRSGLEALVTFAGFLGPEGVRAALSVADVSVLPSHHENFGMAVVEAMAARVPVVISDQVGIHEEIAAHEAGVVTRLDAGELATALGRVLGDEALRRKLADNAEALVAAEFRWPKVAGQLIELYSRLGRNGRG